MKNKKELIMPTLVLVVICLAASAALALTNQVTRPIITAAQEAAAREARLQVLPSADDFTQVTGCESENIIDVYEANNGAGYAITTKAKGYGGELRVMVGIDAEGKIADTQVLVCSETPGLGTRVQEDPYRSQYPGKDASLEGVDVISGSTVSSAAFEQAVSEAFAVYAQVTGSAGSVDPRETFFPGTALTPVHIEGSNEAYRAGSEGYVVVCNMLGYHEESMEVITAIDRSGTVVGVALGENAETPGLGDKVGEKEYTDRFVGKTAGQVAKVDVITGATFSSGSFRHGVEKALAIVTPELLAALDQEVTK